MTNKSLPFILVEEIERLNSATSYEAYILSSKIKQVFSDRDTLVNHKKNICYGMSIIFFDDEAMSEDVIQIDRIYPSKVSGERASDKTEVLVPIESLEFGIAPSSHHQNRIRIDEPWDLPYFSRVVIRNRGHHKTSIDNRFMLMGYVVKSSYKFMTIKLLGGELITASCDLFTPTDSDLDIFERYESSPLQTSHELERTRKLTWEKSKGLDIKSQKDVDKLTQLLMSGGCRQKNISYCIHEMQEAA